MTADLKTVYQLKVLFDTKIYRVIEVNCNTSLHKLAEAIINSFDFDFDHAFGFYDNIKDIYKSKEKFELFCDDGYGNPDSQSVKKTKVAKVFYPKKKMLFLFDYGDDWMFLVECLSVLDINPAAKYPRVIKTVGEAPEQYPDYEENDE